MESTEEVNIVLIVILASLGMLTLVLFIIMFVAFYQKRMVQHKSVLQEAENVYQKKLLEATIEVAELERQKIASNVHDDVGMALQVLKLSFTKMKRNRTDAEMIDQLIDSNTALLEDTTAMIRSIAHELMPGTLVKIGLVGGLSEICRKISVDETLKVNLITEIKQVDIDKKKELHLYRLVKELLNNSIKHDKPSVINVAITENNQQLLIAITHNGKGISDNDIKTLIESNRGIGLKSIYSRAQLIGSQVHYANDIPGEARINVITTIP